MAVPSTQEFTSAAFIWSDLSANVDCEASDPRLGQAPGAVVGGGRMCRAILITNGGTLDIIRADGVTIDCTDTIPAGTLVPCQAKSVRASSSARGFIYW
jgi:hypothetical protein